MGYPGTLLERPKFPDIINYFNTSSEREPFPFRLYMMNHWVKAVSNILSEHLYSNTDNGQHNVLFNRHLALHMLQDVHFCTPNNVMRAFLLLDLFTDIVISERKIRDPRFDVSHDEELVHFNPYYQAMMLRFSKDVPEHKLANYNKGAYWDI